MIYWYDQILFAITLLVLIHTFKFYFLENKEIPLLLMKCCKNRKIYL